MKHSVHIKMYLDRISVYTVHNNYYSRGITSKNYQLCPEVEYYVIHSQYLRLIAYNQLYYILDNRINNW